MIYYFMSHIKLGIVLLLAVLFLASKSYAQKSMEYDNSKKNSVRKGTLGVVGTIYYEIGAAASTTVDTHQEVSDSTRIGITYTPKPHVDTGPARLTERKFKWEAYYHIDTQILSRSPLDYFSSLHATAAVAGSGFPTVISYSTGQHYAPGSISVGPFSFTPVISDSPQNHSLAILIPSSNQDVINENEHPESESYYLDPVGYAMADIDYGISSQLEAIAIIKYRAYSPNDSEHRQYTVEEAFVYPDSIR